MFQTVEKHFNHSLKRRSEHNKTKHLKQTFNEHVLLLSLVAAKRSLQYILRTFPFYLLSIPLALISRIIKFPTSVNKRNHTAATSFSASEGGLHLSNCSVYFLFQDYRPPTWFQAALSYQRACGVQSWKVGWVRV